MTPVPSCRDCAHSRDMNQRLFCCRFPPVVIALPQVNQITGQGAIIPAAVFPTVEPAAWCGEFKLAEKNRVLS